MIEQFTDNILLFNSLSLYQRASRAQILAVDCRERTNIILPNVSDIRLFDKVCFENSTVLITLKTNYGILFLFVITFFSREKGGRVVRLQIIRRLFTFWEKCKRHSTEITAKIYVYITSFVCVHASIKQETSSVHRERLHREGRG